MTKEFAGYAFQKTLATGLIDMALLLANASQLMTIIENEIQEPNFKSVCSMVFVIASIVLQVFVGCLLIYLGNMEKGMSEGVVPRRTTDLVSDSNSNNKRRTHRRENTADSISVTSELKSVEHLDNPNNSDSSIKLEVELYPELPDYSDSSSQTNGEFNKRQGKRNSIDATGVNPNTETPGYSSSSAQTIDMSKLNEPSDQGGASINVVSTDEQNKNNVDLNSINRVPVDLDSLDGSFIEDELDTVGGLYIEDGERRYVKDRFSPYHSRETFRSGQNVRIICQDIADAEEGNIESLGDQRLFTDMIHKNHSKANVLIKYCVFIIVVVNIFISVMGVGRPNGMAGEVVLNGL